MADDVAEEFGISLADLKMNSKPHINMLTMLADDYQEKAAEITETLLNHLQQVTADIKLPILYLIDSIVKNVGKEYIPLFTQAIVNSFSTTFEKVDEKTREQMFKLRQTWDDVFPSKTLYALDTRVQKIDPAWPCNAAHPSTVHLNPKFFKADMIDSKSLAATIKGPDSHRSRHRKSRTSSRNHTDSSSSRSKKSPIPESIVDVPKVENLREQSILQQKMLLELEQQKLKMELLQTQAKLAEQQKLLEKQQSLSQKSAHESNTKAMKLQQMVNLEEKKYINLKSHMQKKFPNLKQIHRVTTEMKVQAQQAEMNKGALTVPEGLLKPSALLELQEPDLHVKPSMASKPRIVQFPQTAEKHKVPEKAATPASTEDAVPVRIAPVSSQLINAALSLGRNVRDPRLRQMSSRLESQQNSVAATKPTVPSSTETREDLKKPSRTADVGNKFLPSKTSDRSIKKPSEKNKGEKSPSKRSDSKSEKKSKREELFSFTPAIPENKFLQSKTSDRSIKKPSEKNKGEKSPSKRSDSKSEKKSKLEELFSFIPETPPPQTHTPVIQQSVTASIPDIPKALEKSPSKSLDSKSDKKSKINDQFLPRFKVHHDILPIATSEEGASILEEMSLVQKPTVDDLLFNSRAKVPRHLQSIPEPDSTPVDQKPIVGEQSTPLSTISHHMQSIPEPDTTPVEQKPKVDDQFISRDTIPQRIPSIPEPDTTHVAQTPKIDDQFTSRFMLPLHGRPIPEANRSYVEQKLKVDEQFTSRSTIPLHVRSTPDTDRTPVDQKPKVDDQFTPRSTIPHHIRSIPEPDTTPVDQKPKVDEQSTPWPTISHHMQSIPELDTVPVDQKPKVDNQFTSKYTIPQHIATIPEPDKTPAVQTSKVDDQFTSRSTIPLHVLPIPEGNKTYGEQNLKVDDQFTSKSATPLHIPSIPDTDKPPADQIPNVDNQFTPRSTIPYHIRCIPEPDTVLIEQKPKIDEQSTPCSLISHHMQSIPEPDSTPVDQKPEVDDQFTPRYTIPNHIRSIPEPDTTPIDKKPKVNEQSTISHHMQSIPEPDTTTVDLKPNDDEFTLRYEIPQCIPSIPEPDSIPTDLKPKVDDQFTSRYMIPQHTPSIPEPDTIPLVQKLEDDNLFVTRSNQSIPVLEESTFNVPSPTTDVINVHEPSVIVTSEIEHVSPSRLEKRKGSPLHMEKKNRKGEKQSIMEQMIADAEKHEASPSPPPPPIISEKFKEIKQSSLSRLRRVGRPRDDLTSSESPEPADVDLRTTIQPTAVIKEPKNEVLGLAEQDVDLRNLTAPGAKKRPSMERLLDAPPLKKSKAEVMDDLAREITLASVKIRYFPAQPDSNHWYNNSRICVYKRLFGSEDVDLRPVLCPPPPSPPPPPIISRSPSEESASWARYKENRPDTYKVKYTPSRRDRTPSVDRFSTRSSRSSADRRTRHNSYQKDVDMRAQPPGVSDGSYSHILMQAYEQHQRGDLNTDAYKRVLSEVCVMREKHQLEEAQRREEEEAAHVEGPLDPISDSEGGSLSGVEDAPSPTPSYSGGEDVEDLPVKNPSVEGLSKPNTDQDNLRGSPSKFGDVDIRLSLADVDIRVGLPKPPRDVPMRSNRDDSPYSRRLKNVERDRSRLTREEMRAQRRERRARRSDEEKGLRYRGSRFEGKVWSTNESVVSPSETIMDVEQTRVTVPTSQYHEPVPAPPTPWDTQCVPGPPPAPWLPGMAPGPAIPRGPLPVMGIRPPVQQDRFMAPQWHPPPGPIFNNEPTGPRFNNRFGPPMGRPPMPPPLFEVPPTDPNVLKLIDEDPTKSINIDGFPRDIRFYGTKAVALMNWDDPREVAFQNGSRRIIVDDREMVIHFNSPPQEIIIDGITRRVRFGAPTRELYIDNQWYEVFFGAPSKTCDIGGRPHQITLEGPPPNVRPGIPRKDLVVGKVSLIVDGELMFPVYLDAKPQKFEVDGVAYIIRFVEALQKVVINGVGFKSNFGGLPQPIILNGKKRYFRLSTLPRGVTPGFLTIINMEGGRLPSPPSLPTSTQLPAPPQLPATLEKVVEFPEPKLADPFPQLPMPLMPAPLRQSPEDETTIEPLHPPALPPPILTMPPATVSQPPPMLNTLDMLTTLMPLPEASRAVNYSYSVDDDASNPPVAAPAPALTSVGEVNVAELLQKLMATGMVPKLDQPKETDTEKPVSADVTCIIKPVDFLKPETLKIRQTALIAHLYSGIQCNSCGVRFPPEQTMKYSQHLDWHFRQNRRDKDSTRTAQTRRYYYDVSDWVQFEEIEDLEERAQPWFEIQEGGIGAGAAEEPPPAELVSVIASDYPDDAACHICEDRFETFFNEDKEEWQLRNAVDIDGKLAHPLCIEDQRIAAEKPIIVDDIDITEDSKEEEATVEQVVLEVSTEEAPAKVEDDDDIMEVMDIEFIKPVFPVEDLTVSDSESVVDKDEERSELLEEENKESVTNDAKDSSQVDVEDQIINESTKDDNAEIKDQEQLNVEVTGEQGDQTEVAHDENRPEKSAIPAEKEEVISEMEIQEVVRNIKKDPDALGGEYEEEQDGDGNKKEKGEVPLPAPIVDTTHTTVTCLIDGNVEFEDTPQHLTVGGPPKIKINITKPNIQPAAPVAPPREPKLAEITVDTVNIAEKLALFNQPPPPGEEPLPTEVKERLRGQDLIVNPPVFKGTDMSGLCSIM